ncbi:MAG: DNA mismatch repair protein MutS, partial [Flavisolibacter sp.]|nr:DNA mismatch repair protein MutS [Flavisolibacter sp.]
FNSFAYKILHSHDYSMVKYSVKHFADFYRGLQKLSALFSETDLPPQFSFYIDRINKVLSESSLQKLATSNPAEKFSQQQNLYYAYHLRIVYRSETLEMVDVFSRLEAWHSMAVAVRTYNLHFPKFLDQEQPYLKAEGLYHVLLQQPVAYDLIMHPEQNFLFLTGANMAGKSTLIKAVGAAVFLAHIGMGVPARDMQLSLFDGLLTNINVADNIAKGESYFFNEVQRIKNTIYKINDGRKWLVLIDELFKGTNVQDAMKCSLAVIKGLIKIKNSLFILSTHLYEIGEELAQFPNIAFKFFETTVTEDQLAFSYQLKDGISNDRIGYVILKREKVVEMLEKL